MLRILIICAFMLIGFRVETLAQQFQKLEGKIIAADTKEPIPFAAIGIPEKGIGTICDEAGNFEFKIPSELQNPTICISALGFKQKCQPVSGFSGVKHTVFLEPANLQLAPVEIKAVSAENLIKEAIRRMPENYADKPVRYTFYQRQLEIINNRPAYIIESVNEAYRNYSGKDYQLTIRKSRGMATSKRNRELMQDTWVQVYTIISYSDLSQHRPYLHPTKYKTYNYQFEKEALIGNDTVYVIAFEPKPKSSGREVAGTVGKLYLHKQSKAIIRLETASNKTEIEEENNSLDQQLAYKVCNCRFNLTARNNTLNFKKMGSRWYLSDVYNSGFTTTTGAAYSKPELSNSITQLVVTNLQTENAQEIPENKRVKPFRNPYSTAPKDMNEAYWQQYNILPLPEAFKNLQAQ